MQKSPENDPKRLRHMLEWAELAARLAIGETRIALAVNIRLQLALRYALQIIGEAANQLTTEMKSKYDHIPWAKMIGLRHRLVHAYSDINLDLLWDTVKDSVPQLIADLEKILGGDATLASE